MRLEKIIDWCHPQLVKIIVCIIMDEAMDEDMGGQDCEATSSCGTEDAGGGGQSDKMMMELSLGQQTVLAIQQLSVIVGVALMVGGMFLLLIGLELGLEWLEGKCSSVMGKQKVREEPEDPASLVGSFKRYK